MVNRVNEWRRWQGKGMKERTRYSCSSWTRCCAMSEAETVICKLTGTAPAASDFVTVSSSQDNNACCCKGLAIQ